jgi:hypothetical protein
VPRLRFLNVDVGCDASTARAVGDGTFWHGLRALIAAVCEERLKPAGSAAAIGAILLPGAMGIGMVQATNPKVRIGPLEQAHTRIPAIPSFEFSTETIYCYVAFVCPI